MCLGCNILDVLICLFQFISRPHPATLTPESITSFMVHHLQSILWPSLLHDGLPFDWTRGSSAPHLSQAPSCSPRWLFFLFFCFFPLLPLTAFSVAVQWEVTGHSKPRLAAAPLVILWLWLTPLPRSCAPLGPLPPTSNPTRFDWQLCGCDTCQTKAPRRSRERRACRTNANGLVVSSLSFRAACHAYMAVIYNLIPMK